MQGPESEARRAREGLLALLFVQLCFGLFPLFVHYATHPEPGSGAGLAPGAIAFWRILCGALVLVPCALARSAGAWRVGRGDLLRLLACSVLGITANMLLALEGAARTSVLHTGLLLTLIPVFTYAIAVLARVERFRWRSALGIALALGGAACLIFARGDASGSAGDWSGNLLLVLNCLSYAGYLVLARTLLARHAPLVVIAWVFLLAVPTAPLLVRGAELVPAGLAPQAELGLAYLILFATIAAYLANVFALARVSASTAAAFIYLQPLVAGASGIVLLGERPGLGVLGGALGLLAGLGLVVARRARPGPEPA